MTESPAQRQIRLENEMDELANEIDPIDPIAVCMVIADFHDLDLIQVLRNIRDNSPYKFEPESMIQDLLESSQSAWGKSLSALIRCIEIEREISEL